MASDPLLEPMERLLNRNVASSAQARDLLAQLDGRSMEVRVTGLPIRIPFTAARERVPVTRGGEDEPTTIIEGSPVTLATLAARTPPSASARAACG